MLAIYSKDYLLHKAPNHIERPLRLRPILRALQEENVSIKKPYPISKRVLKYISLAHDLEYVSKIRKCFRLAKKENKIVFIDGDTYISPLSYKSAYKAVLGVVRAVKLVEKYGWIYVVCRPPGHHAGRCGVANTISQGFCIFNNVAIGALYARSKGYDRVLILDIDLHHGNGTEDILKGKEGVVYCSIHASGIYPGTGYESYNNVYNFPVEPGSGNNEYLRILSHIFDVIEKYSPELVLVSLGFDAHRNDPLSPLNVTSKVYQMVFKELKKYPTIYVLEGGYNISVLYKGTKLLAKAGNF